MNNIRLGILCIIFYLAVSSELKGQVINIVPIGNSITQADNNHQSYRYQLWKKLIDEGIDFDLVGSMTDHYNCGTPVFPDYLGHSFDQNHEGHWGWRCDQVLNGTGSSANCRGSGSLSNWLQNYTPDMALIHLGSNDMFQGQSVETTIQELKDVVTTLRADNPDIVIILAQLIPTTLPSNVWITALNLQIPTIAVDMEDPLSPIYIVDQNTGFDATTDTYDGVHPNVAGEEKMAQKWREAIVEAMPSVNVEAFVYLEGPYNGSYMKTGLSSALPLTQPFNTIPWNYYGTETINLKPPGVVDWILIELRDTTDVSVAFESSTVARAACLLDSSGRILNPDGTTPVIFNKQSHYNLYLVVRSRNHLPVISAVPITETGGIFHYSFISDINTAYGGPLAMKSMGNGKFALVAGDGNADGIINSADLGSGWFMDAGKQGYYFLDYNLDSELENKDKDEYWYMNQGYSSQLPQEY